MKILELRFKNLNSLYGEWCIDFTDPDFVADGLFAITGATGSGKTTILDALCLALYGQTPRLGKMTQSDNEVMSRQTGECFAEVLFEAASGTYRATWHQHRSRKKAGAPLQSPKREVAKGDGTILAEKLKDVQEQVDRITGMSFDRFTRSILLAQGSFDTFLKANADERSPILEQITGTEIYSDISKAVHQRNSTENQMLNELKAGLGGIQLLDGEALEQIRFDLKQVQDQHKEEARKRDAAKAALDCIGRIQTLEKALEDNRAEQKILCEDNKVFKPDAERLAAARRAQPLAVAHAKLVNLRNDLSKTTTDLIAATDALPDLEEQQTNASSAFDTAAKRLKNEEIVQKELVPVLTQTRALDTQIVGGLTTQEMEKSTLEHLQGEQTAFREKEAENKADLEKFQAQYGKAEAYQKQHAQDAELVGQLSAIFQSLEQLKRLTDEMGAAKKAAKDTATSAKRTTEIAAEEADKLSAAQNKFTETENSKEKIDTELVPLLDGTDWRIRLEEIRLRIEIEQRILETSETVEAKTKEAAAAEEALVLKRNKQKSRQREQELLVDNLHLQQKIESLEAERKALSDGQPCPLCGSMEHPYAAGLPAPATSSLEKINADLSELANLINTLTEKQSAANTLCKTLQTSLIKDRAELQNLAPGNAEDAEKIASRIEQIEKLEQNEKEAKTALDDAREALSRQKLLEQTAKQSAETAEEKVESAEALKDKAVSDQEAIGIQLEQSIEPFGIGLSTETAMQLTSRRDQWVDAEKKTVELKQSISNLQLTLTNQTEQIAQHETRIQKQMETMTETQSTIDSLMAERESLFGDRNPNTVEQEALATVDAARKKTNAAQTQLAERKQVLSLARQKIQTLEESKQETEEQRTESEPLFFQSLETAGFEGEAAFLSAQLDDAEQSTLEARTDELKQRHARLSALETEKTQQLQVERKQEHIDSSPEKHTVLVESCIGLQQEIGGFKDRIKANEKAQALHAEKLDGIEKQQTECNRWGALHELIGSADGKKFRNFAQGLTFELMVSHANRQLAKMSDRYLLVRDINQPLDLNVVDNYQAGEIRPVKNLSGGESFIVSLSLALGLSKMASKHIRVDSLFLDEGFGTLDEDALETALEALAELKQDGKLIGVISHVDALKERIGTQINVHTTSGGRGRLSGTGVTTI